MKGIGYLLGFLFLISCSSPLKKHLLNADDLTISFFGMDKPDSVYTYKIVHTTDRKAIEKLVDFVDGAPEEKMACPFDGELKFKAGGNVVDSIHFTLSSSSCKQFTLRDNGKNKNVKMSNEAADLLIALREGRGFY
jgi:hypothetical protein